MDNIKRNSTPHSILGKRKRSSEPNTPSTRVKTVHPSAPVGATLQHLPNEVLQNIVDRLDTSALLSIEPLNPHIRALAKRAFKLAVGPEPLPFACKGDDDFRKVAIAQRVWRSVRRPWPWDGDWQRYPWQFTETLHRCMIPEPTIIPYDERLNQFATLALIVLQNSPERNSVHWNEAVATALMVQGRHEQARLYYDKLRPSGEHLPECTLLTAARFGWPFPYDQLPSRIPHHLAQKTAIAAALGGNVKILQQLLNEHFILGDMRVLGNTVATAAAKNGHVQVLRLLHDNGVNVLERPTFFVDEELEEGEDENSLVNSPLWEAARSGQVATVQFLLDVGGDPTTPQGERAILGPQGYVSMEETSPAAIAESAGKLDVLRVFVEHVFLESDSNS